MSELGRSPGFFAFCRELQESLVTAKVMERDKKYTNVRIFESTGEGERYGWTRGAFTARLDGAPLLSFIYCRVKKTGPSNCGSPVTPRGIRKSKAWAGRCRIWWTRLDAAPLATRL